MRGRQPGRRQRPVAEKLQQLVEPGPGVREAPGVVLESSPHVHVFLLRLVLCLYNLIFELCAAAVFLLFFFLGLFVSRSYRNILIEKKNKEVKVNKAINLAALCGGRWWSVLSAMPSLIGWLSVVRYSIGIASSVRAGVDTVLWTSRIARRAYKRSPFLRERRELRVRVGRS